MYSIEQILNKIKLGLNLINAETSLLNKYLAEQIEEHKKQIVELEKKYDELTTNRRGSSSLFRKDV
jgi:uncharacterized protein Yka (UPF0111/DUF47 family)